MSDENLPATTYRTLLQFALLGSELGESDAADEIAVSLQALRPDLPHACIVLAMNKFSKGRQDDAVRELEESVKKFPDNQLGKAMLAVCLQNSNRTGWQHLLESVIDDGKDPHAMGLAVTLLGRSQTGSTLSTPSNTPGEAPVGSPNTYWA